MNFDITEIMNMLGNNENLEKISSKAGADKDKVQKLMDMGIPTIVKAMGQNASTAEGANSLLNALKQHENDDVEQMIKNPSSIDKMDGEKILKHILSSKEEPVQMNLARETGLGKNQVQSVLAQLAPLLMGVMGQQQKQKGGDLTSLLTDALGKSSKSGMMDMAAKFLDADKDGDVMDDVGKMLGGLFGKKK